MLFRIFPTTSESIFKPKESEFLICFLGAVNAANTNLKKSSSSDFSSNGLSLNLSFTTEE